MGGRQINSIAQNPKFNCPDPNPQTSETQTPKSVILNPKIGISVQSSGTCLLMQVAPYGSNLEGAEKHRGLGEALGLRFRMIGF